jgi:hypothetical protein
MAGKRQVRIRVFRTFSVRDQANTAENGDAGALEQHLQPADTLKVSSRVFPVSQKPMGCEADQVRVDGSRRFDACYKCDTARILPAAICQSSENRELKVTAFSAGLHELYCMQFC